ncbi:MAG: Gfo/Idh/MocA family oxidoreductase [Saprospiraceae bacterium]
MKFTFHLLIYAMLFFSSIQAQKEAPLRVGVAGLTHDHVNWILGRADQGDIEIVGIAEANRELAERLMKRHNLSMDLIHPSLEEMIAKTQPEAVCAFNSIFEHLEIVQTCAPKGIHVMVEKPLAISVKHAKEMEALAKKHRIHLLTNYETTWYPTHHRAYGMIHDEKAIGDLRKIVVHDGHEGPKEIGVTNEFFSWLTDPEYNGAGALTDFGCYGANLITWLMKGQRPERVIALTQQIKPDIYPKVDDEATILLEFPQTQGIIQASWNWPFGRKDMHIYGKTGYIYCDNATDMRIRLPVGDKKQSAVKLEPLQPPHQDPFALLAAVVKGKVQLEPFDLSSLENNMIVVEILEAAKKSAKKGKAVSLK